MYTLPRFVYSLFFFFNDTATTEIYTLSLHDALPICMGLRGNASSPIEARDVGVPRARMLGAEDRKSTRLNSSHLVISYAVFCLKKKTSNTADVKYVIAWQIERAILTKHIARSATTAR